MSMIVFAGAAQFAAVGYVAGGLAWPGIILLTGAAQRPPPALFGGARAVAARRRRRPRRAVMAHLLTDEAFALTIGHFRRLGRADERGYWIAAIASTFIPWNLATLAGVLLGGQIPDPARFGIDVIFPAAMVGLAVGLITGRRELVAALVGAAVAVVVALGVEPGDRDHRRRPRRAAARAAGPGAAAKETAPLGTEASAERYSMPGTHSRRRPGEPSWSGGLEPDAAERPGGSPPDEHEPRPARRAHVRGHLPVAGARAPDAGHRPAPEGRLRLPPARRAGRARGARGGQRHGRRPTTATSPTFHVGIEWLAVFLCLALVAWRRNLFLGLVGAVASWPSLGPRARLAAGLTGQPRRASASISISRLGSISADLDPASPPAGSRRRPRRGPP